VAAHDAATSGGRLSAGEKLGLIGRSLFLQSVWNRRTMQSVGFCFAMLPVLTRLRADVDGRRAFLARHLAFFNTNPVLASYALGAAAAAERSGRADAGARASEIKRALAGPLGMAGDSLFWATLRPLAGLLGVVAALAGKPWAALVFLVVYNVPHLALRARGVLAGAAQGPGAVKEVLGPRVKKAVTVLRAVCACAAGAVVALAVRQGPSAPSGLAVAAVVFVGALAAARARLPLTVIGVAATVAGAAVAASGILGG